MRIGFGGRQLGQDSHRLLCEAIERGVELVDVAPAWGESEARAGAAIRETRARDRVVLATVAPPAGAGPLAIQRAIEASLRATRLDALGLALLDAWHDEQRGATTWPELAATLARLVREGKVLRWGVIAGDPRAALAALDEPILERVQAPFHVQDRRATPLIEARPGQVIVRRPLDGGSLAPLAADALAFALEHPVAAILVGMRRREHLDQNLRHPQAHHPG
jgi:aryl-alcohol dehydrogenase-like predicted oxidoreductase